MRILVVNWELPTFDRTSGGLRLFTLLVLLQRAGITCDYLLMGSEKELARYGQSEFDRYVETMATHGIALRSAGVLDALKTATYDAVLFEWFSGAERFGALVRLYQPQAAIVVDSVDLSYLRWAAMAVVTGKPEDRLRAEDVKRRELRTYRQSDLVLTLTEEETREVSRELPGLRTFEVPNIHQLPAVERAESTSPTVLFIGSFTHEPNVDAVKWVTREIWPAIHAARPDARLVVIGQRPPDDLLPPGCAGVEVLGHVPSTLPYLARAWVSIAPLRFGAGMKGKVGEALAAGVPLVTTSFGAQGYGLANGESAFVEDSAADFSRAVLALLADAAMRQRFAERGRAIVQQGFSEEAVAARVPALKAAINGARPARPVSLLHLRRTAFELSQWWQRSVAWRLNRHRWVGARRVP
jgi:glycosyltransferase involved in cell wall biosynthesis